MDDKLIFIILSSIILSFEVAAVDALRTSELRS